MKKTRLGVKFGTAALIALIALFGIFTLTACNNGLDVAELSVVEDTVPAVAVVGEFDLSGIRLVAVDSEGNENELAATPAMLTSEGKAALKTPGAQSVTLFYGGKTVVLNILIVEQGTETVTVTFCNDKGKVIGKRTVVKGTPISNEPTVEPTEAGTVFTGWFDNGGRLVDLSKVDADVIVTAQFGTNATKYEVRFLDYNGDQVGETQYVLHGTCAIIPEYVMPYELESFSWPASAVAPITRSETFKMSPGFRRFRVTYYYAFSSNRSVRYPVEDNNAQIVETVDIGSQATKKDAVRQKIESLGMNFIEWNITSSTINADTEMVAFVADRKYTITFNDSLKRTREELSGTVIPLYTYTDDKEGMTFHGVWKGDDNQIYDKGELTVVKDLVLTPQYDPVRTPVRIEIEFKGLKTAEYGGSDQDIVEVVTDDNRHFEDNLKLNYFENQLSLLISKSDAKYSGYRIESVSYNDADVTSVLSVNGIELKLVTGDHVFSVVAVNPSLITDGLQLQYNEGLKGYVVKSYNGTSEIIYIPEKYNDKDIVAIDDGAFSGKDIISISIAPTVKKIGNDVFRNATFYNSDIEFAAVSSFGQNVFYGAKTRPTEVTVEKEDGTKEIVEKPNYIKVVFGEKCTFKSIDGSAFANSSGIKEVVLPASVTKITNGNLLSPGCDVEKINLNEITELEELALISFPQLSDVGSLAKIKKVGSYAFAGTALESVELSGLESVGVYAFVAMPKLKTLSLSMASGVAYELSLDNLAGSTALTSLTLSNGIEGLSGSLKNVGLFGGLISVDSALPSLSTITFGAGLKSFAVDTASLSGLSAVVINGANEKYFAENGVLFEKVENGYSLIYYPANKLGDYTIPETVNKANVVALGTDFTDAHINALTLKKAIRTFIIAAGEGGCEIKGNITSVILDYGKVAADMSNGDFAKLQQEWLIIVGNFMNDNTKVFYLSIDGLEKPEEKIKPFADLCAAFGTEFLLYDSKKGTTVKYDSTNSLFYRVDTVGNTIVAYIIGTDKKAVEITIPAKLGDATVIGMNKDVFVGNADLKTLTIAARINSMGDLTGCTSLETISFAGWREDTADYSVAGFLDTKIGKADNVFVLGGVLIGYNENVEYEDKDIDPLEIRAASLAGVVTIPEGLFMNSSFKKITLPDSVTRIEKNAFNGCTKLEEINLENVIRIGDFAFAGCSLLKEVDLMQLTEMGEGAFSECTALTRVYMAKRVNDGLLPVRGFSGCKELVDIRMPEMTGFQQKSGTSEAFMNCKSLVDISFISRFAEIANFAFSNCVSIKKLDFTQTAVTTIGQYAFAGCTGLEIIIFSSSVTSVGDQAFNCDNGKLKSVEFVGRGGLLAPTSGVIPKNVFPSSGYYFYLESMASQNNLSNYESIERRNSAPTVAFRTHPDFVVNNFSMAPYTGVLYLETAPEAPEIEGYVFADWYLLNESNTYRKVEFPYNVTNDVSFYAKYFDVQKGSFEAGDFEEIEEQRKIIGLRLVGFTRKTDDDVYIPSSFKIAEDKVYDVLEVDMAIFADWKGTKLVIPEGVTRIFNSNPDASTSSSSEENVKSAIKELYIPSTVKRIEEKSFISLTDVETISFADGIDMDYTEKSAFDTTAWYTKERTKALKENGFIAAGNVAIEYISPSDKNKIVIVPAYVTVLADKLFESNAIMEEIRLNSELRIIGNECFKNVRQLKKINYVSGTNADSSIESVGQDAFLGTGWYESKDANMVIIGTILLEFKSYYGEQTVNIPDEVTEISAKAFYKGSPKEIIFGTNSKLVKIGDMAFGESKLESLILPASLEELGVDVFAGCESLRSVDMSKTKIAYLPQRTFDGCSSLTEVMLPATLKAIKELSFRNCSSLNSVVADGLEESDGIAASGILSTPFCMPEATMNDIYIKLGAIVIKYVMASPEYAEYIVKIECEDEDVLSQIKVYLLDAGNNATDEMSLTDGEASFLLKVNSYLVKLTGLPAEYADIAVTELTLGHTSALIKLKLKEEGDTLPSKSTVSKTVKRAVIPEGTVIIDSNLFANRTTLNEVFIPASVKVIGKLAFYNCTSLETVIFEENSQLEIIEESAFLSCTALKSFNFPSGLKEIRASAFNKSGLTSVVLGDSVEVIGMAAFKDMAELETVVLGDGLKLVGERAFAGCSKLYKVEWNWTTKVVETQYKEDFNSFDILVNGILTDIDPDGQLTDAVLYNRYVERLQTIFSRPTNSRSLRIYFEENSYLYVIGAENNYIGVWGDKSIVGMAVFERGDYPTVMFEGSGMGDGQYYMENISAEVIESLPSPSKAGSTFKGWLLNNKPVEFPLYVYSDLTLTPDWFKNELADMQHAELGFKKVDNIYVVNKITSVANDGVLYIPSSIGGTEIASIDIDQTDATSITYANKVKKLVLTNASAFNDVTENVFRFFPNLEEVTLLRNGKRPVALTVEDGVVYAGDKTVLVAYLYRYRAVYDETGKETGKEVYKSFEIPESVLQILPYAFAASQLETVTVSKNVYSIGDCAFNDNLDELRFASDIYLTDARLESFQNTQWHKTNKPKTEYRVNQSTVGLFFTAGNILYQYIWTSTANVLVIPEKSDAGFPITVIASNIYRGTQAISFSGLTLPSELIKINENAFAKVGVTDEISVIGNKLTDIADNVFNDTAVYKGTNEMMILGSVLVKCQNMQTDIVVPEGIVSISGGAFDGSQLRSLSLPSTLRYIGQSAFANCNVLESVTIPQNVVEIGEQAFVNCKKLKAFTFASGSKLEKIGEKAFSDCSMLVKINIPYTVKYLGAEIFMNCVQLTEINFSERDEEGQITHDSQLEYIGEKAFSSCSRLKEITIPVNVTAINELTFYKCTSLTTVKFEDNNNNKVSVIEKQAFSGCTALGGTIDLHNPDLVTVVLPNNVIRIREKAFEDCSTMLGIQLNYNIAYIENDAFVGCLRLTKVDLYASSIPEIGDRSFERSGLNGSSPMYNLRIYVKDSANQNLLKEYKAAWNKLSSMLYERKDLPRLQYKYNLPTAESFELRPGDPNEGRCEIVIDPTQSGLAGIFDKDKWYYYSFEQMTYDNSNNATGEFAPVENVAGDRKGKNVNSVQYQKQKDEQGEDHVILILDYDKVIIENK